MGRCFRCGRYEQYQDTKFVKVGKKQIWDGTFSITLFRTCNMSEKFLQNFCCASFRKDIMSLFHRLIKEHFNRGPFVFASNPWGGLWQCHVVDIVLIKLDSEIIALQYKINFKEILCSSVVHDLQFTCHLRKLPYTTCVWQEAIIIAEPLFSRLQKADISCICSYEWALVRMLWRQRKELLLLFRTKHVLDHLASGVTLPDCLFELIVEYVGDAWNPFCLSPAQTGILGIRKSELETYQKVERILPDGVYYLYSFWMFGKKMSFPSHFRTKTLFLNLEVCLVLSCVSYSWLSPTQICFSILDIYQT